MRVRRLSFGVLLLAAVLLVTGGCGVPAALPADFNLIFKYGVGAGNELNTFEGTYTYDMIVDPSITVPLSLSSEELSGIYQKMREIGFFGYPDKFSVFVSPGESIGVVMPYSSYYFQVAYNSRVKKLSWEDRITTGSQEKADQLRELIRYIQDIIVSKEEYKQLPPPRGGYL